MKFKYLFLLSTLIIISYNINAQRGVKIGYLDTEYILQNLPEYKEAEEELNNKALEWKKEIDKTSKDLNEKRKLLENEKNLLTQELYEERLEDIKYEESLVLDYQQKRFGSNGDLLVQKRQLIKPVQDQIFSVVRDIVETQKLDFVFDRSADVVMIYASKRYDISERVLRTITRASKRKEIKNRKEKTRLEEENIFVEVDQEKEAQQNALKNKKEAREAELAKLRSQRALNAAKRKEQKEKLRNARKREAEERRQKALEAKQNRIKESKEKLTEKTTEVSSLNETKSSSQLLEENRQQKIKDKNERQQVIEERRRKIQEQRQKVLEAKQRKKDSMINITKLNFN